LKKKEKKEKINRGKLKKKDSNFGKKKKKRESWKKKMQEKKKECTADYCCNPQCIWVWGNNDFPTPFRNV
jgi:Icc-related predicted phosphoesterase